MTEKQTTLIQKLAQENIEYLKTLDTYHGEVTLREAQEIQMGGSLNMNDPFGFRNRIPLELKPELVSQALEWALNGMPMPELNTAEASKVIDLLMRGKVAAAYVRIYRRDLEVGK